jgi:soluble lytic murein transglycosylase
MIFFRWFQRKGMGLLVAVVLAWGSGQPVCWGDIYMYRDANGVLHFTDTPKKRGYRLYMKDRQRRRSGFNTYAPNTYDAYLVQASRTYQLSFSLLKAMVKVESDFNPRAISKKGAKGLMQIMPENYPSLQIVDPFDPWESIMGGAQYLRRMLNRFGDTRLALAAYNAGPSAVDQYAAIPPYPETTHYVDKVLRYYDYFKKRE